MREMEKKGIVLEERQDQKHALKHWFSLGISQRKKRRPWGTTEGVKMRPFLQWDTRLCYHLWDTNMDSHFWHVSSITAQLCVNTIHNKYLDKADKLPSSLFKWLLLLTFFLFLHAFVFDNRNINEILYGEIGEILYIKMFQSYWKKFSKYDTIL